VLQGKLLNHQQGWFLSIQDHIVEGEVVQCPNREYHQ